MAPPITPAASPAAKASTHVRMLELAAGAASVEPGSPPFPCSARPGGGFEAVVEVGSSELFMALFSLGTKALDPDWDRDPGPDSTETSLLLA
jgi:hypothetical protein